MEIAVNMYNLIVLYFLFKILSGFSDCKQFIKIMNKAATSLLIQKWATAVEN